MQSPRSGTLKERWMENTSHISFARELRKNMTKEEKHLWYDYLKPYRQTFGIAFTRQKVFGNYILDFYCPKAKLAIELDGSQHYEEDALYYDKKRTAYLDKHGIVVLRYTNRDIHTPLKKYVMTLILM